MVDGKSILRGMIGAYLMLGIDINKIDWDNHILYITVPEKSYEYENPDVSFHCAEDLAKRIKRTLIESRMFPEECIVKFKTKDIYWTKEMAEANYQQNRDKTLNMAL